MVSNYESNLSFAAFGPRIIFALLAGNWSDKNGRKRLIQLPLFGQIATTLVLILNWAFLHQLPFNWLYAELVNEACGNFIVYYLGIYSYLADITLPGDNRTFRIGVADGLDYVSTMLGTTLSPQLFKLAGFYLVFSVRYMVTVTFFPKTDGILKSSVDFCSFWALTSEEFCLTSEQK